MNGQSVGRQIPSLYMNIPHPVYEFKNVSYSPGEIKAVGYINGRAKAEYVQKTPETPTRLVLEPDDDTITADGADFTSVTITAIDSNGTRAPYAADKVTIEHKGEGIFIGEETIELEGGRAVFFVQSNYNETGTAVCAVSANGMEPAECEIEITPFTEKIVPVSDGTGDVEPVQVINVDNSAIGGH